MRARVFESAVNLLRMTLPYCLGERGLRSTAAWAASIGLAVISNVALLYLPVTINKRFVRHPMLESHMIPGRNGLF